MGLNFPQWPQTFLWLGFWTHEPDFTSILLTFCEVSSLLLSCPRNVYTITDMNCDQDGAEGRDLLNMAKDTLGTACCHSSRLDRAQPQSHTVLLKEAIKQPLQGSVGLTPTP